METAVLTAAGLAAPAGLNAYIPLLVLALADRATDKITLHGPYDAISSNIGIAILVLLLTIEIMVDKVPGVDHINDLIQSFVRPAAGVIVALASTSGVVSISPAIMVILGLLLAGSVNAVKVTSRPAFTLGTGGVFNPFVSMAEDGIAVMTSLIAVFLPALVILILAMFLISAILLVRKVRGRRPSAT
ncbi:MAG: DUF4126 domain-containing protein [Thermomicrobiales bacterium]